MKLTYTIVWFEDSKEFINSLKSFIEDYLKDLGFSANIVSRGTGEGSLEVVQEHDPDLLLVDFNLIGSTNGEDIVKRIRENELFVDVVFYAQREGDINKVGKLDGVFSTERDNLRAKILKIINLTVKKQQDVNNIRGIIIAETIDLERKMETFLAEYFGSGDKMRQSVFERLYDYNHRGALTAKQKFEMTNSIFKKAIEKMSSELEEAGRQGTNDQTLRLGMEGVQAKKRIFDDVDKLLELRDIMAHWEELQGQRNTLLCRNADGDPIPVDESYCKETRRELNVQSENLELLINDVKIIFQLNSGT
jgi:CheY-like chemotaxis protein